MARPQVELIIMTERPLARNDESSELDVLVEIRGTRPEIDGRTATAMNLCLVIDRSGSMSGDKLEAAKRSAIDIYHRLGEHDLFTVITFDEQAEVIVNPQTPREKVPEHIGAITTGGMTNLSLGWYLGLLELQTYAVPECTNRLILISDGQANAGETKRSTLSQEAAKSHDAGITTSTIGVGNDFQEDILEALATGSGGRFWYIQDSRLEDILDEEFRGALAVVIDRPRVELLLPDGVTLTQDLNKLSKGSNKYRIRPLKGDDTFNFAVRLGVDPTSIQGGEFSVGAELYDGTESVLTAEASVSLRPMADVVVSDTNAIVRSAVVQHNVDQADEQILTALDDGDLNLLKRMLVVEVDGMKKVQDALGPRQSAGRMGFEQRHVNWDIDQKGIALELFDILGDFTAGSDLSELPEVRSFLLRWRKMLRHGMQRRELRHMDLSPSDHALNDDLLEDALELIELLQSRYPQHEAELTGHAERFRARLAGR